MPALVQFGSASVAGVFYGGIELPTITPEVALWVEASTSTRDIYQWQRWAWPGKNRTGWAFPGHVADRPVKLGSLYWPTGATRWAVAQFLVTDDQWGRIKDLAYSGGVYQPLLLDMADEQSSATRIQTLMWMLPSRPQAQIAGDTGMYLMTLVDDRYFWQFRSTGDLDIDEGTTTWEDLYTAAGTALGVTITPDTIPSAYLKPGTCLRALWEQTPLFLDAVAYNVGQRIVRGLDGTVRALSVSNSKLQVTQNLADMEGITPKWSGGQMLLPDPPYPHPNDSPGVLPESVTLTFHSVLNGVDAGDLYAVEVTLASLALSDFSGAVVQTGNSKVFHDGLGAEITTPPTPDNLTDLQALAQQFATDWYRYQVSNLDVKYDGIAPWVPEGWSDSIEWRWWRGEISTRIQRGPWNDLAEELCHGSTDSSANRCCPIPAALIDCTGAAFSWYELQYAGSGLWEIKPGGLSGTFNAYERNGRTVPTVVKHGDENVSHNTVVWMHPQDDGEYVFDIELENFPAMVTGDGPTYDFTEHYPPHTELANGRTGTATEMNGVTGANGKVVQIFVFGQGCDQTYWFAWERQDLTIPGPVSSPPSTTNSWVDVNNVLNILLANGTLLQFCPCGSGSGTGGSAISPDGGVCCPGITLPDVLFMTFSNLTGTATCFTDVVVVLIYDPTNRVWVGTTSACGSEETFVFFCSYVGDGLWHVGRDIGTAPIDTGATGGSTCSPFDQSFDNIDLHHGAGPGTGTLTITP